MSKFHDVDHLALASIGQAAQVARFRAQALSLLEAWLIEHETSGISDADKVKLLCAKLEQIGMRKADKLEGRTFMDVARDLHKNTLLG